MADVNVNALRDAVLEFLDSQMGERFAITNQSLDIFVRFAADALNKGVEPARLERLAGAARDRALASAAADQSRVSRPGGGGTIPLLREKDADASVRSCNFDAF